MSDSQKYKEKYLQLKNKYNDVLKLYKEKVKHHHITVDGVTLIELGKEDYRGSAHIGDINAAAQLNKVEIIKALKTDSDKMLMNVLSDNYYVPNALSNMKKYALPDNMVQSYVDTLPYKKVEKDYKNEIVRLIKSTGLPVFIRKPAFSIKDISEKFMKKLNIHHSHKYNFKLLLFYYRKEIIKKGF